MNAPVQMPTDALAPSDWDEVHARVQTILDELASRVRVRCPSVRDEIGRTSARAWYLYSYRGFNPNASDSETEDVVAGITFAPAPSGIGIQARAEIGGAETGQTDYASPPRVVPADRSALLTVACELAEELGQQDEVVAKALAERRSPPDYRNGLT